MKTILTIIAAALILYVLFVALNTYIYSEKQGDDQIHLQLGF